MSLHSPAALAGLPDGWLSDLGIVREEFPHDKLGQSFDIDIARPEMCSG
jgi:hypothetical protein